MMTTMTQDVGGAIVRRRFSDGGKSWAPGDRLSRDEILAKPAANIQAMVNVGMIALHPAAQDAPAGRGERHIVGGAGGKFSVIEGRKLNDRPLTKAEAEELAAR